MTTTTLRARFVFPVDGPPISDGAVSYRGERIVGVGPWSSVAAAPANGNAEVEHNLVDLGSVALLPGLINAHTHLELSAIASPLGRAGQPLPEWLSSVIEARAGVAYDREGAVGLGLAESVRCGVTRVADIVQDDVARAVSRDLPVEILAFRELIGLRTETVGARRQEAEAFLDSVNESTAAGGLSPHAPYSVHPKLLEVTISLAQERQVPVAMHLAESAEEIELLAYGGGPFREFLVARGVWQEEPFGGVRPLDLLRHLARAPRALVVHGNFLDDEEIEFCAAHANQITVVYCPRTHAYFGHPTHPLAKLLERGANVAVGTDSRASNPDLDVLAELRHIAWHVPGVPPDDVLTLATQRAAQGLGWEAECGTISPGKLANLTAVPVDEAGQGDPYELLFDRERRASMTIVRGRVIYGAFPE